MSVSNVGGGGSSNRANDRDEPKVQPKPKDPPKAEGAQAQQTGTKTAKNQVKPNQVKPKSDGFETQTSSSSQRSQQQAMLGSTTAPEKTEATEHAQAGALEKLGLTAEDVVMAGNNAAPHLEKAAQAAVKGNYEEALGHLKDAATSSPKIAEKAVRGLAQNLPDGVAKTLLTDKALVQELVNNSALHSSVGKLIKNPTDLGAVRELVGNDKLRDATLTALGKDPGVQAQLEKIGLTPEDLVQAGKAAPKLIESFEKLQAGDVKGALTDFQKAVEAAPDLAAKLGQKLLDKVPQGIKDQFAKLGITPEALQKSGDALPHLYDAADAAAKGEWQKSFDSLKQAAGAAPEVVQQAIKGLAKQLPDSLGAVKSLLTDDAFVKELATNKDLHDQVGKLFNDSTRMEGLRGLLGNDKARDAALTALGNDPGVKAQLEKIGLTPQDLVQAGKAAPKLWDAFEKLQAGDVKGALTDFQKAVEASPDLSAKLGQKLLDKVPQGIKDQFAKLGITPEALQKAGAALPKLYDAADAASKGDWKGAYSALKDAAAAAPDVATQALKGLAKQLPDSLGAAKSLLTNDAFLKELVSNKDLQGSLEKLVGGDTSAIKDLLRNDKARDAALTAIGNDPGIKAQLEKIGLTPQDLVAAGKAAPAIMDAFEKLQSGDVKGALTDFQKAVETSPELAAKLGQKLLDKVPQGIKDQFAKLGITPETLQKSGAALPKLYEAADAASKGDWKGAYSAIKDAAAAAPELATQALKGLANQLPDSLGAAKSLLTNDAFLKELVSNKDLQGSLEKLVGGDTSAIKDLLRNDKARDAALTAIGNDPGIKAQLEKAGLTPEDLVAAGKAAPAIMDAFEKLQSGDVKGALTDFQKAVETSPELAAKLGQKLLDKVPQGIKDQFAKLGITP
ncbi:hypothetical protein, partial [Hyalangium minutum]|uniref:hypothetical protein n=1 Tax=Hyalangium minutum TaxID=394096 RepID=UPI0005C4D383